MNVFKMLYPKHCETCKGTGQVGVRGESGLFPCPHCVKKNVCPRCGVDGFNPEVRCWCGFLYGRSYGAIEAGYARLQLQDIRGSMLSKFRVTFDGFAVKYISLHYPFEEGSEYDVTLENGNVRLATATSLVYVTVPGVIPEAIVSSVDGDMVTLSIDTRYGYEHTVEASTCSRVTSGSVGTLRQVDGEWYFEPRPIDVYAALWPNYCRGCKGSGQIWNKECPDCVEHGCCPRCGGWLTSDAPEGVKCSCGHKCGVTLPKTHEHYTRVKASDLRTEMFDFRVIYEGKVVKNVVRVGESITVAFTNNLVRVLDPHEVLFVSDPTFVHNAVVYDESTVLFSIETYGMGGAMNLDVSAYKPGTSGYLRPKPDGEWYFVEAI